MYFELSSLFISFIFINFLSILRKSSSTFIVILTEVYFCGIQLSSFVCVIMIVESS
jgi:hypothetical protein